MENTSSVNLNQENNNLTVKFEHNVKGLDGWINDFFDAVGDNDLIDAPEINESAYYLLLFNATHLYYLTDKNIKELQETGETILDFESLLSNYIDTDNENDKEFLDWLN